MPSSAQTLKSASLEWRGNLPCSTHFDDLYYSQEDGLAESRYVFCEANRIAERLEKKGSPTFTIAETGFGTGLNFFTTLHLYKALDTPCRINFVSIEKYPLSIEQIKKALSAWPELTRELEAELTSFATQYPDMISGAHQLYFCQGRVCLTLIFGDVHEDLPKHSFSVDAWYLDGFNPAKNPEMWQQSLFDFMAERAKKDCSFATFTAAGFVRRGLQQAGFGISKYPGFGRKRDMLIGQIEPESANQGQFYPSTLPNWAKHASSFTPLASTENSEQTPRAAAKRTLKHYDVAVVGAGLAGLNTAYLLAEQGLHVVMIEAQAGSMSAASGQDQLIMYSKLPAIWNQEARLACKLLSHGQNYYRNLQSRFPNDVFWQQCGQIQLDWHDKERERSLKRQRNHPLPTSFVQHVDEEQASQIAQIQLNKGGQWFPNNGVLNSQAFAQALCRDAKFEQRYHCALNELHYQEEASLWQLSLHNTNNSEEHNSNKVQDITASKVVLASAASAKQLAQCQHLPLKPIRGQSSTTFIPELAGPACVLCGEGYLCPSTSGHQHFGATYELNDSSTESTLQSHLSNIEKLCHWLPEWQSDNALSKAEYQSKAGLRCTSPDYFPMVGPAPKQALLEQHYQALSSNASAEIDDKDCNYPGLYVSLAHGSKGLVSSALAAQHLNALICQLPSPLEQEQISMLSPSRFLIRNLIRTTS